MRCCRFRLDWVDYGLLALLAACVGMLGSELYELWDWDRGFCRRIFTDEKGNEYAYQVFVPYAYHQKSQEKWPLILFLHGAGQSGDDGEAPVQGGLAAVIMKQERNFPCFAVFPQSLSRSWRAEGEDGQRALAIVDDICRRYAIDPDRIYLTGLSMGGGGTWSLATAVPERWAAIAPVCGYGDPGWASRLAPIPCWCFHGVLDEVISVEQSRGMVEAVRQAGGQPRYTEYPDVGHNAWDRAYAEDAFFDWLLKQKRSPTKSSTLAPAVGPGLSQPE